MRLVVALLLCLAAVPPAHAQTPVPVIGSYDEQNAFARILRGELPAAKVYEDRHILVFMDHRPVAPGHVLIISRTSKARNLLEMSPRDMNRLMKVAQRVMRAQFKALGAEGITLTQNNGAGQTVPHLHIHLIPRRLGIEVFARESGAPVPIAELQPIADKIAAAMR